LITVNVQNPACSHRLWREETNNAKRTKESKHGRAKPNHKTKQAVPTWRDRCPT
jgi:hypothetical protein